MMKHGNLAYGKTELKDDELLPWSSSCSFILVFFPTKYASKYNRIIKQLFVSLFHDLRGSLGCSGQRSRISMSELNEVCPLKLFDMLLLNLHRMKTHHQLESTLAVP